MEPLYVRHLAGYAPEHQIEVIPGVGHLPMRDQPLALAEVLTPWLQRLGTASCDTNLGNPATARRRVLLSNRPRAARRSR